MLGIIISQDGYWILWFPYNQNLQENYVKNDCELCPIINCEIDYDEPLIPVSSICSKSISFTIWSRFLVVLRQASNVSEGREM